MQVVALTQASAMYEVSAGRAPDRLQSGALIGNSTAARLGLEVGDPVEYDGQLYRIQGIIESQQGGFGGGGSTLVLPLSALRDQEYYDSVTILAEDGDAATAIAEALEARFNADEQELSITNFGDIQEQVGSFLGTLNLALLGIGSISLIVASVAILNVMLMSTIERRGEIGVLRAVGIRRGEVLRMILTEAMLLGVIGGVVGAVVSLGVGLLMFDVLAGDATLVFEWSGFRYLVFGFGFAVVASLLSGIYPAWKAANDRAVDSLRG